MHDSVVHLDPGFFSRQPGLLFDLTRCQFRQLLEQGETHKALLLARSHLTPLASAHPHLLLPLKVGWAHPGLTPHHGHTGMALNPYQGHTGMALNPYQGHTGMALNPYQGHTDMALNPYQGHTGMALNPYQRHT